MEEDTKAGETTAGATDTATDMGTDTAIGIATATAGMTDAVRPRPMFAPTDGRTDKQLSLTASTDVTHFPVLFALGKMKPTDCLLVIFYY